jgi:hypothetical protein
VTCKASAASYNLLSDFDDADALPAVFAAMERHVDSLNVQTYGVTFLWCFARVQAGVRGRPSVSEVPLAARIEDGLRAVVGGMQRHSNCVPLQAMGCDVLSMVAAENTTAAAAVVAAGGVQAVHAAVPKIKGWSKYSGIVSKISAQAVFSARDQRNEDASPVHNQPPTR